jgi:hypothetical protein
LSEVLRQDQEPARLGFSTFPFSIFHFPFFFLVRDYDPPQIRSGTSCTFLQRMLLYFRPPGYQPPPPLSLPLCSPSAPPLLLSLCWQSARSAFSAVARPKWKMEKWKILISQLRDQRSAMPETKEGEHKGTFVSLSTPLTRSSRVALPSRKAGRRLVPRAKSANRANSYDRRLMVRLSACQIKSLLLVCSLVSKGQPREVDSKHSKQTRRLREERAADRASKKPKEHSDALASQQLSRKTPALSPCSLRGSTGHGSCLLLHASSDITKYNTSSPSQSSAKGSVRAYPHLHPSSSSTTTGSNNKYNNNNNTYMNLSGSKKHKEASSVASVGLPRSGPTGSEGASGLPLSCSAITLSTARGSSRVDLGARHVQGTNCRQTY